MWLSGYNCSLLFTKLCHCLGLDLKMRAQYKDLYKDHLFQMQLLRASVVDLKKGGRVKRESQFKDT